MARIPMLDVLVELYDDVFGRWYRVDGY